MPLCLPFGLLASLALAAAPAVAGAGSGSWNAYGVDLEEDGSASSNAALAIFSDELQRYAGRAARREVDRSTWAALRLLGGSVGAGGDGRGSPIGVRDLGALRALSELSLLELTLSAERRPLQVGNRSDLQLGTPEWRRELANDVRDLASTLPGERMTIGAGFVALYWVMATSLGPDADGFVRMEGFSSLTQAWWLSRQAMRASVRRICEIGFNGGHSALAMLVGAPSGASLVSFDLVSKSYSPAVASFIESVFPSRFRLVPGNSGVTVPQYALEHVGDPRCDLVYIDGGHTEEDAMRDLLSMSLLAKHGHTLVVMDDLHCDSPYCVGPAAAWSKFQRAGRLTELGCETEAFRGWCWGVFT